MQCVAWGKTCADRIWLYASFQIAHEARIAKAHKICKVYQQPPEGAVRFAGEVRAA